MGRAGDRGAVQPGAREGRAGARGGAGPWRLRGGGDGPGAPPWEAAVALLLDDDAAVGRALDRATFARGGAAAVAPCGAQGVE